MYDPTAIMTDRLIIKEADSTDLDTLLNLWTNTELRRFSYMLSSGMRGPGDVNEWWTNYQLRRSDALWERQFVIQIKDGPFIGVSGWSRIEDPDDVRGYNIEPRLITVLADIKIDPDYSELGYGVEAMSELLWWAFDPAGVDTILIPVHKEDDETRKALVESRLIDTGIIARNDFRIFELKKDNWSG